MRILVDENIPRRTVEKLQSQGHDVSDIRGTALQGISDEQLWEIAQREQRMIITTDRGFALRRQRRHFGILIVLLRQPNSAKIHDRVLAGLSRVAEREWEDLLLVMRDRTLSRWRR